MIIPIVKQLGQTPLEALEQYRSLHSELQSIPMTYAGRLDPMAEGLLLVLSGDTVKNKDEYLNLPKKYEAEILLGFASDTYDALGLAYIDSKYSNQDYGFIASQKIEEAVKKFVGTNNLPYPPYSSKPVEGKPLFEWAKQNSLDQINMPLQKSEVFSAELESVTANDWADAYNYIVQTVGLVKGEFRQSEILQQWQKINEKPLEKVQVVRANFYCSSGTYIRSLAHELGKQLEVSALLLKLKRTEVGPYKLS